MKTKIIYVNENSFRLLKEIKKKKEKKLLRLVSMKELMEEILECYLNETK
jgi:hypothetical protein